MFPVRCVCAGGGGGGEWRWKWHLSRTLNIYSVVCIQADTSDQLINELIDMHCVESQRAEPSALSWVDCICCWCWFQPTQQEGGCLVLMSLGVMFTFSTMTLQLRVSSSDTWTGRFNAAKQSWGGNMTPVKLYMKNWCKNCIKYI